MKRRFWIPLAVLAALLPAGCAVPARQDRAAPDLTGAWRSAVRFKSGVFATLSDFEFLYVFNAGGTMTESSNYDAAPPVAPAYGVWRPIGSNQYEARYEFFTTKAPARLAEITNGGGWMPSGRGVLVEKITLSADGRSFTSTLRCDLFDTSGKPVEGGGDAEGRGTRIGS